MRKLLSIFFTLLLIFLVSACSETMNPTPVSSPTPAPTIPAVSYETCRQIQDAIEKAAAEDVQVYVSSKEDGVSIHVSIDPVVIDYQYAMTFAPVVDVAKAELSTRNLALTDLRIGGVFYEEGEQCALITWDSEDFETGHFLYTNGKVISREMTVQEVLDFCDYPG